MPMLGTCSASVRYNQRSNLVAAGAVSHDVSFSLAELARLVRMGQVWVGSLEGGAGVLGLSLLFGYRLDL